MLGAEKDLLQSRQGRFYDGFKGVIDCHGGCRGNLCCVGNLYGAAYITQAQALGRFKQAQPQFRGVDVLRLVADKNKVAAPLDIGSQNDDVLQQPPGGIDIVRGLERDQIFLYPCQLAGCDGLDLVIQPVLLAQLQPLCLLGCFRLYDVPDVMQFLLRETQLLQQSHQFGDVLLPENIPFPDRVAVKLGRCIQLDTARERLTQLLLMERRCLHGALHRHKRPVRDQTLGHRYLKQRGIPHIGLDKPAPDARLKGRCKGQALHHGHITGDRMHPRHI